MTSSLYDTVKNMQPSEAQQYAMTRLERDQHNWAVRRRPDQVPPSADGWGWNTWIYSGGRGAGKTRLGAEETDAYARSNPGSRILIIGRTAADVRESLVEGESGILALRGGRNGITYTPATRRLKWLNGAQAFVTSADEPDSIRGVEVSFVWGDEVAHWRLGKKEGKKSKGTRTRKSDAFDNLLLAARSGDSPKIILTTTPTPTKMLKKVHNYLVEHPIEVRLTQAPTHNNASNLHENYLDAIEGIYNGTELAKTELQGQWPWPL